MYRRMFCLTFVIATAFVVRAIAEPALTLVRDGAPNAVIVLAPQRAEGKDIETAIAEKHAAMCLQGHLLQMSGARLEILEEKDLAGAKVRDGRIVLPKDKTGPAAFILVGEGALSKALGVTSEDLKPGGIHVKTTANALVLVGHPEMCHPYGDGGGIRHAAIAVLEGLGCRYLWPGELGKVVPRRKTISVGPTRLAYNPPIGQRRIRSGGMRARGGIGLKRLGVSKERWTQARKAATRTRVSELIRPVRYVPSADYAWGVWHGLGGDIGIRGGHAFGDAWEKWGKEHPDRFALQADGTRDQTGAGNRERLCVSNLGLIEAIADEIIDKAAADPNKKCFSVCPNDGGYSSFCMCDKCKALDPPNAPGIALTIFKKVGKPHRRTMKYVSLTDRYVYFWNRIAERVAARHPDVLLLGQAYSIYSAPPVKRKLHPNIVIRYVPSGKEGWEGWRKAGTKRIYWRPNILGAGRRTGTLIVYARRMAETMGYLARNGMLATDMDSITHTWANQGLNYYVAARMNWDPTLKYEDILNDYCSSGFGPAAGHVKRYFLRAEEVCADAELSFTPDVVARLRESLNKADEAAGADETIRSRVAFLRMGLNYTDLHETLARMAQAARDKQPVDRDRARQLLELHYMVLRDITCNHNLAVNAALLMWGSGDLARWSPIKGRGFRPDVKVFAKTDDPACTLTGRENSFEEMRISLGLKQAPTGQGKDGRPAKRAMEADEAGRVFELPAD